MVVRKRTILQLSAIALLCQSFSTALTQAPHTTPTVSSNQHVSYTGLSAVAHPSLTEEEDDHNNNDTESVSRTTSRRLLFQKSISLIAAAAVVTQEGLLRPSPAHAASGALVPVDKNAPKLQEYEDFTMAPEGWAYKDSKEGKGNTAGMGDRVVFEWTGYTVGYFGRPFEAKGGPQGGAFDKDTDYSRTIIGSKTVVPAVEMALSSMKPGGVRQVLIPYGPVSYPPDDLEHVRVGPKPTTFSGQRALNFVLENPRVDRTLLINVKVIRVDKSDGKGGFVRG